jgi:hypothetical protein
MQRFKKFKEIFQMIKIILNKLSMQAPRILLLSLSLVLNYCSSEKPGKSKIALTGEDLSAWQEDSGEWFVCGSASMDPANEKRITTSPGEGLIVNGKNGLTKDIHSREEFGDIRAHIEFMVPKGSNSGVYFMARYEIQVLDSWGKKEFGSGDAGGIYQRWDENREPKGYEGAAPRVNAARKPGEWQEFDVVFQAPRFDANGKKIKNAKFVEVVFNGTVVHENVEVTGPTRAATFEYAPESPTGPLMLQGDHGPVAYRNIWITPM